MCFLMILGKITKGIYRLQYVRKTCCFDVLHYLRIFSWHSQEFAGDFVIKQSTFGLGIFEGYFIARQFGSINMK